MREDRVSRIIAATARKNAYSSRRQSKVEKR
jgi:hypothetical protein